jgi:hypothetical protein
MSEVENKVRSFIEENFLFRDDRSTLADSDSLLDAGVIEFQFRMADAEIVPANLDSIKAIVAYVEGKVATAAAA